MYRGAPPRRPPAPDADGNYRVYHDPGGAATPSATVAHALAALLGFDVTDAECALHERVDPAALDRLFAPGSDGAGRRPGHVAFRVGGYRVTVYGDGEIVITPPRVRG